MCAEKAFRPPSGKESCIHSDVLWCPHVLELSWGLNYIWVQCLGEHRRLFGILLPITHLPDPRNSSSLGKPGTRREPGSASAIITMRGPGGGWTTPPLNSGNNGMGGATVERHPDPLTEAAWFGD